MPRRDLEGETGAVPFGRSEGTALASATQQMPADLQGQSPKRGRPGVTHSGPGLAALAARSHVTHDTPNALWRKAQNQRRWSASRLHIPFLPKPQRALETPENSRGASAPAKSARAARAKALSAPRACGRQGALRLRRTGLGAGGEPGGAGPRGHPALPSLALPAGRGAPEPGSRS